MCGARIAGVAQKYFAPVGAGVAQGVRLLDQGDDFFRRE